jgi:hypothetical protein
MLSLLLKDEYKDVNDKKQNINNFGQEVTQLV